MSSTYVKLSTVSGDVVTLAEMKEWLKETGTSNDALIQSLIDAAVEMVEDCLNRSLLETTWCNYRDSFRQDLTLRRGGFLSVVSIEYLVDGSYVTLDPSEYTVKIGGIFGVICEVCVPSHDCDCNAVKITFKAGYGPDATFIPETIKLAIKQIVASWFENRGDCDECISGGIPIQTSYILRKYKIIDLGC